MCKPNIAAFHGDLKSISGDKLDSLHLFMTKLSDGISLMLAPDLPVESVYDDSWSKRLLEKIRQYDWKSGNDILREIYMTLLSDELRRTGGEFYTPDWLGEKAVSNVIDMEFVNSLITAYYDKTSIPRFLDPTCGSGIFLFHGIKQILYLAQSKLISEEALTGLISKSVSGTDQNPVAISMTKANILRALPVAPRSLDNILQLDAIKQTNLVSRIVSNPPWIPFNRITDENYKNRMLKLAMDENLWSGAKLASSFDIAILFTHIGQKRLLQNGKSAWVLPFGSIKGANWQKFHTYHKVKEIWDLGGLPFPAQSNACVQFYNSEKSSIVKQKLVKTGREKIKPNYSWKLVEQNTKWRDFPPEFEKQKSAYIVKNKAPSRMGATPISCLLKIAKMETQNNGVKFTTEPSRHEPWKTLGAYSGVVPANYIIKMMFGDSLLPYRTTTPGNIIAPINDTGLDFDSPITNNYWTEAEKIYARYKSSGRHNPQTLLAQLNFGNKLRKQLTPHIGPEKSVLLYNTSGTWLCAARTDNNSIINGKLFRINLPSIHEALYLEAILNAECLQLAYQDAKNSDRDFMTHFWYKIPIPKFDKNNLDHIQLTQLAIKCETIADSILNPARKLVRKTLILDGISLKIDKIVNKILPDYSILLNESSLLSRL